jgi:hypothetical protein
VSTDDTFTEDYARRMREYRDNVEAGLEREAMRDDGIQEGDTTPAAQPERPAEVAAPEAQLRFLSEVQRQSVEWLWRPRIPRGFLTMFDGDPEMAKSTTLLELAARGSRRREWPDGQPCGDAFKTVILSAEDPAEMVIRPRIDQFGGDPSMIAVIESIRRMKDGKRGEPQLIDLTVDLPAVIERIRQVRPRLVIVDPITAYLGRIDSFKDSSVRSALAPLVACAADLGFALVVIRHLNKNVSSADVLYRGGGSIGFIGAARSGLMAIKDPNEEGRLLLAHYKCNLAAKAPTLAYRVVSAIDNPEQPSIEWLGIDPRSAKQLHEAGHETAEDKSARGDARHFLKEILGDGEMKAEDILADGRRVGHAVKTLNRAKADLKVVARKEGFRPSVWYWRLP